MEEFGEDSMTCESNAREEDQKEFMVKDVTGTFLLFQLRQLSAFKTFYVTVISLTVDTSYKIHAAVFLLRS